MLDGVASGEQPATASSSGSTGHHYAVPMIRQMTIDDLAGAVDDGQVIVDVREPAEYAQGHVPSAVNIPLSFIVDRCTELDRDKPVYLVCGGKNRAMEAAGALDQGGYEARPIDGGTRGWIDSGRAVEN